MTAATTFPHQSAENRAFLLDNRTCQCEPYEDWFTYKRWQDQQMQVQKGQSGLRLPKPRFITTEQEVDGKTKTKSFPKTSTVFCRCQVQPK